MNSDLLITDVFVRRFANRLKPLRFIEPDHNDVLLVDGEYEFRMKPFHMVKQRRTYSNSNSVKHDKESSSMICTQRGESIDDPLFLVDNPPGLWVG